MLKTTCSLFVVTEHKVEKWTETQLLFPGTLPFLINYTNLEFIPKMVVGRENEVFLYLFSEASSPREIASNGWN